MGSSVRRLSCLSIADGSGTRASLYPLSLGMILDIDCARHSTKSFAPMDSDF